jgi:hypothetical protein
MRAVVIADVLAGLCCLGMAGWGFVIVLISRLDPLHPDDTGIALGSALLGVFLLVPALTIVISIRLASTDFRAAIICALVPFAFVAAAVVVLRTIPWPAPPPPAERVSRYPETPATYVWRLTRWRF